MRYLFILLSAGLFFAAAAPSASAKQKTTSGWVIEPIYLTEPKGVADENEYLWVQKIAPLGLVESEIEFRFKKIHIPVSTQFFQMFGTKYPTYCSVRQHEDFGKEQPSYRDTAAHICIADRDQDGVFDHYSKANSIIAGFPMISRLKSDRRWMSFEFPVKKLKPDEINEKFELGIYHSGTPMTRNDRLLQIRFGLPDQMNSLTSKVKIENESFPEAVKILGSTVTVTAVKDEKLYFEVDRPIPLRPFVLGTQTVFY